MPRRKRSLSPSETHGSEEAWFPPSPILSEQLTEEQRVAASRALRGENLFVTGAAGTGKSFLLRFIIQELELVHPGRVARTAPTGIAAANIGGQTLHSFARIGLGTRSRQELIRRVRRNKQACERWRLTRVLVIDEVSMMAGRLLEDIAAVARAIRTSRAPFGGLQLVFCGDFHQLPPVQLPGEPLEEFCFQSTIWKSCDLQSGTVVLQEPVRQSQDPSFASILNEIRVGVISPLAECKLSSCNSRIKPRPTDGIEPTKLYCTNHNVDIANATHLASLPGRAISFTAKDTFRGFECNEEQHKIVALLDKRVPSVLQLKRGAQVILVRNMPELGLVNGSRGVVDTFEGGLPRVQFDNGSTHCIGKCHFEQESSQSKAMRVQVPFKLGWALTIHKAQGMTLTRAEVQLEGAFTVGQIYVALSRLTSTNGLWIRGGCISTVRVMAHPRVIEYYWCLSGGNQRAVKPSRPLDRLFNLQRANPSHAASTWVEAPRFWGEGVITVD